MRKRFRIIPTCFVLVAIGFLNSGCIVKRLIPAPQRMFTASDLLIMEDKLPTGWTAPFGPKQETDNRRPRGSMDINLYKSPEAKRADITQLVAIYPSVEGAKVHFSEDIQFPGETSIEGWTFTSSVANEGKFSCYTYSNLDYPICTWEARYQEILVQVIGRLKSGGATLDEMEIIVKMIDEQISKQVEAE